MPVLMHVHVLQEILAKRLLDALLVDFTQNMFDTHVDTCFVVFSNNERLPVPLIFGLPDVKHLLM